MAFSGNTGGSGTGLFGSGNAGQQPAGDLFISILPIRIVDIVQKAAFLDQEIPTLLGTPLVPPVEAYSVMRLLQPQEVVCSVRTQVLQQLQGAGSLEGTLHRRLIRRVMDAWEAFSAIPQAV